MITVKKFPHFFRNSLHFFLLLIIIHFSILSKKTAGKTDGFLLLIITAPAVIISMTFHEQYSFYFRLFIRILCDHRYTRICNFSAEFLAVDCFYSCFYAFRSHNIWVLSHCAKKISVVDQVQNRVRFIKTNTDDVSVSSCFDGISGTSCGAFITSEDTTTPCVM